MPTCKLWPTLLASGQECKALQQANAHPDVWHSLAVLESTFVTARASSMALLDVLQVLKICRMS